MIRNKKITVDIIQKVMHGQPWCECVYNSKSSGFDCVDCENVYSIINEFIRTSEFEEWLKRRYKDG